MLRFAISVFSVCVIILGVSSSFAAPPAPSHLTATSLTSDTILLNWQDNASGSEQEEGFIVQRRPYGGSDVYGTITVMPPDTTSYVDTDSIFGLVDYTYRVGAYTSASETAYLKTGWKATSSNNNNTAWQAIDWEAYYSWLSGGPQQPGMWFQVDMWQAKTVNKVVIDVNNPWDHIRGVRLYLSSDGSNWGGHVVEGAMDGSTRYLDMSFTPRSGIRYLKLELTASSGGPWRQMRDILVYGEEEPKQLAEAAATRPGSGDYLPRANFGARMEPSGNVILNGAGQESTGWFAHQTGGFLNYQRAMGLHYKPVMQSEYWHMQADDEQGPDFIAHLKEQYDYWFDWQVTPVIGVEYMNFENSLLGGQYDAEIHDFCTALETHFDGRALIRIGFEPDTYYPDRNKYKQGFIHIHNIIRSHAGLDRTAIIWSPAHPRSDIMDWYPGDQYCDWWGLSPFDGGDTPGYNDYCDMAAQHGKPVFLCEMSCINHDVSEGESLWNNWFVRIFNTMRDNPEIKGFTYINWNWRETAAWQTWGDNRIEGNAFILSHWVDEMKKDIFRHGDANDPVYP